MSTSALMRRSTPCTRAWLDSSHSDQSAAQATRGSAPHLSLRRDGDPSSVALTVERLDLERVDVETLQAAQVHDHLFLTIGRVPAERADTARAAEEMVMVFLPNSESVCASAPSCTRSRAGSPPSLRSELGRSGTIRKRSSLPTSRPPRADYLGARAAYCKSAPRRDNGSVSTKGTVGILNPFEGFKHFSLRREPPADDLAAFVEGFLERALGSRRETAFRTRGLAVPMREPVDRSRRFRSARPGDETLVARLSGRGAVARKNLHASPGSRCVLGIALSSATFGVGPKWIVRRSRVPEAAERVARGEPVGWVGVAQELGYHDQGANVVGYFWNLSAPRKSRLPSGMPFMRRMS
jgi:hypothetical protein